MFYLYGPFKPYDAGNAHDTPNVPLRFVSSYSSLSKIFFESWSIIWQFYPNSLILFNEFEKLEIAPFFWNSSILTQYVAGISSTLVSS